MSMTPVDEIGHGKKRRYHEPVKVKLLDNGSVRITEHDGDQFSITAAGKITPLTKKAVMGARDGGVTAKAYESDDGKEHAYYGRGYVQLTWWSNYASAGINLGLGLNLLLDPDLVKIPDVAYEIMAYGMRTGAGFANGHRLSKYFFSDRTDYIHARRMVNGSDHAADIAAIAKQFETILLGARFAPNVTGAVPFL